MKKRVFSLLALLLMFAMLLSACGDTPGNEKNPSGDTTEAFVDVSPYPVTETLFPANVSEELYKIYKEGKAEFTFPATLDASYAIGNAVAVNDCRLLSMTIPVYKTGKTDENGDFVLTLFVYELGFSQLKKGAKRSYQIKINADAHGLSANKSKDNNVIKVDLSSYNINIAADEALGLFSKTDTLTPALVKSENSTSNAALNLIRKKAPYAVGSFVKVGTADAAYSHHTLMVDFEWEKVYESKSKYLADKNSYDDMINALKSKYEGKYVSVIGDSISSFDGVCNDATANVTIEKNEEYYPKNSANLYDQSLMYWGKLIKDLNMRTCVINGWSGSCAVGRNGQPNMLERAVQLHRDGGTPDNPADDIAPDVIIIYLGINDVNRDSATDATLMGLLNKAKDSDSRKTAVDTWFKSVAQRADKSGSTKKGEAYDNFEQVYALSLRAIKEKYPNSEIYCLTLQESNHKKTTSGRLAKYNQSITAIADYFGATIVDQAKDIITADNCHAYASDSNSLHPNALGHAVMAESILKEMYKNK